MNTFLFVSFLAIDKLLIIHYASTSINCLFSCFIMLIYTAVKLYYKKDNSIILNQYNSDNNIDQINKQRFVPDFY